MTWTTEECRYKESGRASKGGGGAARLQPLQIEIKKKNRFCKHNYIKLLSDLPFSRNHPLKSVDD